MDEFVPMHADRDHRGRHDGALLERAMRAVVDATTRTMTMAPVVFDQEPRLSWAERNRRKNRQRVKGLR